MNNEFTNDLTINQSIYNDVISELTINQPIDNDVINKLPENKVINELPENKVINELPENKVINELPENKISINNETQSDVIIDLVDEHDIDCDLYGDCESCCELGECTTKDGRYEMDLDATPGGGIICKYCLVSEE